MIGRITLWNNQRGFGFITLQKTEGAGTFQEQYFFHHSNFKDGETPVLGGIVVFNLGEPIAQGKKVQAVGIRYATRTEIQEAQKGKYIAGLAVLTAGAV